MPRPRFEVGQIIRDWRSEFYAKYPVVPQVRKSFGAMAVCRTRALGGHVEVCPECGEIHVSYNSCRDRHCPKCQNKEREVWIEMRKEEIMPGVKYFHVVFTVPDCLHPIAMSRQALFYSCMFRAAWATLKKFFDAKGLQGGMTSILHTWGSNLFYHPHIHCIVTGGGVDKDGVWHSLDGCKGIRKGLSVPCPGAQQGVPCQVPCHAHIRPQERERVHSAGNPQEMHGKRMGRVQPPACQGG